MLTPTKDINMLHMNLKKKKNSPSNITYYCLIMLKNANLSWKNSRAYTAQGKSTDKRLLLQPVVF